MSQQDPGKDGYRELARTRVADLIAQLERQPDAAAVAEALDLARHLARAIDAFHMEAIRFRMFTLDRLFRTGAVPVDEPARVTLEEVKHALEAAGFQTRSITH